jgi:hypothetical protein
MNHTDVFKTIVKLSNTYLLPMRSKADYNKIIEMLEESYRKVLTFPTMDDGHYLMVRKPVDDVLADDGQDFTDIHTYFGDWLAQHTRHGVVALYSDDMSEFLFFFEHISDATTFKQHWC